ncbi:MAG TPA: hypothetical protein VLA72_19355 [Anaerolineales bacterium]|nr:hypothetical protein [Anaerolineales bacterium]
MVDWNDPVQFSNTFFYIGAFLVLLGFLSIYGGFTHRANFNEMYAASAGQANMLERTQQNIKDLSQRYGVMTILGIVGLLLIAISALIGTYFVI